MDILVNIYNFFAMRGDSPQSYDWYHFMWVVIVLSVTVFLLCACKNMSDDKVRKLTGILWGSMAILELMKQLVFSIYLEDGSFVWDYSWYSFPFQFCATPLYVLPIVAFAKDGKLRDTAITYISTFSLFAGICVYVYPNDVFTSYQLISAQAMFHHGVQVFLGIYLAYRYREKMHWKNLVRATIMFSALLGIAMILNLSVHHFFTVYGIDDTFNMFFISPYYDCTLPVLSIVYANVPYVVFLFIYIFGFMLCAGVVLLLMKALIKLIELINNYLPVWKEYFQKLFVSNND